jgi:hypothetical protein
MISAISGTVNGHLEPVLPHLLQLMSSASDICLSQSARVSTVQHGSDWVLIDPVQNFHAIIQSTIMMHSLRGPGSLQTVQQNPNCARLATFKCDHCTGRPVSLASSVQHSCVNYSRAMVKDCVIVYTICDTNRVCNATRMMTLVIWTMKKVEYGSWGPDLDVILICVQDIKDSNNDCQWNGWIYFGLIATSPRSPNSWTVLQNGCAHERFTVYRPVAKFSNC